MPSLSNIGVSKFLGFFGLGGGVQRREFWCGVLWCYTLDLGLDIVDGIGGFYLKGDGFPCEGFHEDLHDGLVKMIRTSSQSSRCPGCFGLLL